MIIHVFISRGLDNDTYRNLICFLFDYFYLHVYFIVDKETKHMIGNTVYGSRLLYYNEFLVFNDVISYRVLDRLTVEGFTILKSEYTYTVRNRFGNSWKEKYFGFLDKVVKYENSHDNNATSRFSLSSKYCKLFRKGYGKI